MTSDICTDDGIRNEYFNNSRSHTISDTELECVVACSKKWKVYRKKKGQSRKFHTAETLKIKGYLSPPVTGQNLTEIIACSNEIQSQHTEVEVILQATSAIIKSETPEEVTGRFRIIFMCNIYFHRNMVQSEYVIYLYSNFQSSSTKLEHPL